MKPTARSNRVNLLHPMRVAQPPAAGASAAGAVAAPRHVAARVITACIAAAGFAACSTTASTAPAATAQATLQPTSGNNVSGVVTFTQRGDRIDVTARVGGFAPNSEHGFHVHEKGDCSSPDGSSAGGHFNPGGQPHGSQSGLHHAGDMPSLTADAAGNANASFTITGSLIGSGTSDMMSRAVIVHAQADDYATQPTGNSGARLACGVIGMPTGTDPAGKSASAPRQM